MAQRAPAAVQQQQDASEAAYEAAMATGEVKHLDRSTMEIDPGTGLHANKLSERELAQCDPMPCCHALRSLVTDPTISPDRFWELGYVQLGRVWPDERVAELGDRIDELVQLCFSSGAAAARLRPRPPAAVAGHAEC